MGRVGGASRAGRGRGCSEGDPSPTITKNFSKFIYKKRIPSSGLAPA